MTMSFMNLEKIAENVGANSRFRDFIKISGGGFDPSKLDYSTANLARPYVSDMAWALFSAIQSVIGYYVAHWAALSNGIDSRKMVANDAVSKLILAVAPEYKEYLDANGLSASYQLLERLDSLLLGELKRMYNDYQQDKDSVEQAAEILKHARILNEKMNAAAAE